MRKFYLLTIVLFCVTSCNFMSERNGCDRWDNVDSVDPLKYLKTSECFRIGGVGYAGTTPPEEIALRKIMKQKDAPEVLQRLFKEGSVAGRLFGLLGLYYIDRSKYEELALHVRQDIHVVETQGGCIIDQQTVKEIVESIEAGSFDIYMQREI